MQEFKKIVKRSRTSQVQRFKRWHKHPFGMPVAVFIGLIVLSGIIGLIMASQHKLKLSNDTHIVIMTYDGSRQTVPTNAHTVGSLIQKLRLKVGKYDRVEPTASTEIVQDNFRVNIYRAVPVTIHDGDQTTTSYSAATTARSVVAQTGMTLYAEDTVTAAPAENIVADSSVGQVVTIDRSVPINLNIYGTQTAVRTHAKTVAGLVAEKHIRLLDGATMMPTADTPLTPGQQVFVLNKGVRIVSTEETIATPLQNVDDNSLTLGSTAVRQAGSPGKQLVTYQITVDGTGKEVARQAIQTIVTQVPVIQIVAVGKNVAVPADKTVIMQQVGIAQTDYGYVDYIISHEGGWAGVTKYNRAGSGAYGICQALPGSKMASAGGDWATNPVTQLRWCNSYAQKFGGWGGAYDYWISHHYW
jgi:uncharacterized protein YabE (DUF348 family)